MDELVVFVAKIRERQVKNYMMELSIISNPHSKEPRELWRMLEAQIKKPLDDKLDKAGMERLKQRLSDSGKIVVK